MIFARLYTAVIPAFSRNPLLGPRHPLEAHQPCTAAGPEGSGAAAPIEQWIPAAGGDDAGGEQAYWDRGDDHSLTHPISAARPAPCRRRRGWRDRRRGPWRG